MTSTNELSERDYVVCQHCGASLVWGRAGADATGAETAVVRGMRLKMFRRVDAFSPPRCEEVVELPAGYGHAWANNLGEYIVTEDSNFNPNLSSNLHWEPMQQGGG